MFVPLISAMCIPDSWRTAGPPPSTDRPSVSTRVWPNPPLGITQEGIELVGRLLP
jgi:hypothetical protein